MNTTTRTHTLRSWWLICSIVALLVAAPIIVAAQTPEAPQAEAAVLSQEQAEPTQTPTPTPTPTPEPLPTEAPVIEQPPVVEVPVEEPPVIEESPADQVSEEESPVVEEPPVVEAPAEEPVHEAPGGDTPERGQGDPADGGDVEETVVPSPTAEPTVAPTPTAEATPTAAPKTRTSLQATATLTASCAPHSGGGGTNLGGYVTFRCTYSDAPFKVFGEDASGVWRWHYSYGENPLSTISESMWKSGTVSTGNDSSGNEKTVYIYLQPQYADSAGNVLKITITLQKPNDKEPKTFHLAAVHIPFANDLELACGADRTSVPTGQSADVSCTLSAIRLSPEATVAVSQLDLSAFSKDGWTASGFEWGKNTVELNSPARFSFKLSPGCAAVTDYEVKITPSLSVHGHGFTGPTATVEAHHDTSSTLTARILPGPEIDHTTAYSFFQQSVENYGSLTYEVQASCGSWAVNITASDFTYNGSPAGDISAGDLTLTQANLTTPGAGVSVPEAAGGSLGDSRTILRGSNAKGTYNQTLDFSLEIPAGARVGEHKSTLTIDVTAEAP